MSSKPTYRVFITGGTGFIGSRLVDHWWSAGHDITVLSRNPKSAREKWDNQITVVSSLSELSGKFDILVNLAGEGIADKRWTSARKNILRSSRIALTEQLVDWAKSTEQHFQLVFSGSAVGVYGGLSGSMEAQTVEEGSPVGHDFSAQLCTDWENAASGFASITDRLVILRTGLVLGPRAGMLNRMWLPFSLGLGGKIGCGSQYMPWIHLEDYIAALDFITEGSLEGAVNMTAPNPVTNAEFSSSLGRALNRPAIFPMPAPVATLLFGEMSELLLRGQRAVPGRLIEQGFEFNYNDVSTALTDIAAAW